MLRRCRGRGWQRSAEAAALRSPAVNSRDRILIPFGASRPIYSERGTMGTGWLIEMPSGGSAIGAWRCAGPSGIDGPVSVIRLIDILQRGRPLS